MNTAFSKKNLGFSSHPDLPFLHDEADPGAAQGVWRAQGDEGQVEKPKWPHQTQAQPKLIKFYKKNTWLSAALEARFNMLQNSTETHNKKYDIAQH